MHKRAYEAFMRVVLEGFYHLLDESHPVDNLQVQTCLDEIGTLADELCRERHDKVFQSRAEFSSVFVSFLLNTLTIASIQHYGCPI